ncbi:MAG TPA: zinc ribbon domain-containing protein [Gammaproteobacteria bacterium]|nr:zinc ribbon domain-containing protein [Gammaproteobacteria bacterium]
MLDSTMDYVGALPVDARTLLSNHRGVREAGLVRRRTRLAARLGSLKRYLEDGERVTMITLLGGRADPWRMLLKQPAGRALLVFTDRRLFHVPLPWPGGRRCAVAEIRYIDRQRAELRGGTLIVWFGGGGWERVAGIPVADRAKIRSLLEALPPPRKSGRRRRKHYLCPRCTAVLQPGTRHCAGCGLDFHDPESCGWQGLLLPGGGYFHLGCRQRGRRCAAVEAAVLAGALIGVAVTPDVWLPLTAGILLLAGLRLAHARHARRLAEGYVPVGPVRPARR